MTQEKKVLLEKAKVAIDDLCCEATVDANWNATQALRNARYIIEKSLSALEGDGKCRVKNVGNGITTYRCQSCGHVFIAVGGTNYCPGCGREIVEVK